MRKKRLAVNLSLLFLSLLLIAPLLGEFMFRAGIALNIPAFKNPSLYADLFSDDDFWKLEQDWRGRWRYASPQRVHPRLGWSQVLVSPDNPLGVTPATLARMKPGNPKILFYGDSYVKGTGSREFQLPEYMNARLEGVDVVDLGVAGYGTDQMYLMFNETYQRIPDARVVLLGILLRDDIDRTALSLRTSQKPYFLPDEEGNLQLKGLPIDTDQERFFRRYSLSFKSYLFAFLKRKFLEPDEKIVLKKKINARLLELFKTETESAGMDLIVVLFYPLHGLSGPILFDEWLKEQLNRLKIPYISTREILLSYAKEKGVPARSFYDEEGWHHHNLGNQVIAEGILKYLRENNYAPGAASS